MELQQILDKINALETDKVSNKEMAFFGKGDDWEMHLGNPSSTVMLGESSGEIITEGTTVLDCAEKMLIGLLRGGKE